MSFRPPFLERFAASLQTLWKLLVRSGPDLTLAPDAVVLVLDVIEPYKDLWSVYHHFHLKRLLRLARANNNRIIFTRWERTRSHPADAIAARGAHWSFVLPDDAFVDGAVPFLPGLVHESDEVLGVTTTNALASSSLCIADGAPLILSGMWLESCVINTARAAAEAGHFVSVFAAACSGHFGVGWFALWTLQSLYADVCFAIRA